MRKLPQLKDVVSDQQNAGLELDVDIDRDTASRLGVTAAAIDEALYDVYGQRFVATSYTQQNEYRVVFEAAARYRATADSLDSVYVKSASGASVPLRAIAKVKTSVASLAVNHHGQFPAVTISFNLAPNASLGQAIDAINKAELSIHMPPSVHADFQGTAQAFTSSLKNEPLLVVAALLAVYIVLGVLYESYVHPVTILSTLPSAGIGALVALLMFGVDLSVIAIIGLLLLIGIVKKNAILLDRLRPGSRTQGRCDTGGRDRARLLAALSAHHDDDLRGPLRRPPARLRGRPGLRAATAPRHHHRGRAPRFAASHPLHDARRVLGARTPSKARDAPRPFLAGGGDAHSSSSDGASVKR